MPSTGMRTCMRMSAQILNTFRSDRIAVFSSDESEAEYEHKGGNKYPVVECSVRLERLSASTLLKCLRECCVLLERLPARPVEVKDTSTELCSARRVTRRAGGKDCAPGVLLTPSLRQSTVRQGVIQRQKRFARETALQVTQRSARRRGRARASKHLTSTDTQSRQGASIEAQPQPDVPSRLRLASFSEMIKEMVEETGELANMYDDSEKAILKHWLVLNQDTCATYLRLLGLKGPWIRAAAIQNEFPNAQEHFQDLEKIGFVSTVVSNCELQDVVGLLRKDELELLKEAAGQATKQECTKLGLQRAVVRSLAASASLQERMNLVLGGCVHVRAVPRALVERALLLLSAWQVPPLDGNRLGAARLLVLRPCLRLLAFPDGSPLSNRTMFFSRELAIEWDAMARERYSLEASTRPSDLCAVAEDLLQRFQVHHAVGSIGSGLGCNALGDVMAETLGQVGVLLQRQATTRSVAVAVEIFRTLLDQRVHAQKHRVSWVVSIATLLQSAAAYNQAAEVLIHELMQEDHVGALRADILERVRILNSKKRPGMDDNLVWKLNCLLRQSSPVDTPFNVISFSATTLKGSTGTLKQTYVHRPMGQPAQYMSIEEKAMAHLAKAYPCGLDDEGGTLESLAVLALWPAIYDANVRDVWGNPCQTRPLDWGSPGFWLARDHAFERQFSAMLVVEEVVADLRRAMRTKRGTPSLVRWDLLESLEVEELLKCVTVPVFKAICRRLFKNYSSYRPGFPDLLLWNPQESKSLFVEVKSSKDKLSRPQTEWLNFLRDNGAEVAVVVVRGR